MNIWKFRSKIEERGIITAKCSSNALTEIVKESDE